jgi:hypothetical protein
MAGMCIASFRTSSPGREGFRPGFSELRKYQSLSPGQSHPKPHQCDIKATSKRVDSQAIGTPKPPQSHPKATPRLPQGYLKATLKPPASHPQATCKPSASQPQATHKPPQCDPHATLMRPSSHPQSARASGQGSVAAAVRHCGSHGHVGLRIGDSDRSFRREAGKRRSPAPGREITAPGLTHRLAWLTPPSVWALDGRRCFGQRRLMPRTMRVEYPGAIYHVVGRGDRHRCPRDICWQPTTRNEGTTLNYEPL